MGNCCGGTATVPSEPAPQVTQKTTLTPVLSQFTTESPVPSSSPPSRTLSRVASEPESAHQPLLPSSQLPTRTRSRAASKPESTPHSRVSSQGSNSRSRKKSAPQPFQSSKSPSQKARARAETLSAPTGSSRSNFRPTNPGWFVASRPSLIKTSIKSGRSQYWRNLWSSPDFTDQPLEECVKLIHNDIVKIWNQDDRNRYLSSDQFKINMSHVVKDLAVPAGGASTSDWNASGDKLADWVYDIYRGRQENVQCVMGYIVNLTVILDEMFRTAASNVVTEDAALMVMETYVRSSRRDSIHQDIRRFVTETFPNRFADSGKDLVLEKIIELIRQYCPPPFRE